MTSSGSKVAPLTAQAAAAPRILGGLGSTVSNPAWADMDQARNNPFASTNVVVQGLTMEAKLNALSDKLAATERRLDMFEIKLEMKANKCCTIS